MLRKRFHFRKSVSPTYSNLSLHLTKMGWHAMPFSSWVKVSERLFAFNLEVAMQLEYKHLLANLVHSTGQAIMPETYVVNEETWMEVFLRLSEQPLSGQRFILKPSLLNNGQHIHLFDNIDQFAIHYQQSKRLSGPHVLQHYLETPELLRGHKYSIRMFVVLTNDSGGFLYKEGYLNVAKKPYQSPFFDPSIHLTNEHLSHHESNVIQIPASRLDVFPHYYSQIKQIVSLVWKALQHQYLDVFMKEKSPRIAIYGFDFLVDAKQRVWLIEANHGPCFPTSREHPLQSYVYDQFWQQFIIQFLEPIIQKDDIRESDAFERLDDVS